MFVFFLFLRISSSRTMCLLFARRLKLPYLPPRLSWNVMRCEQIVVRRRFSTALDWVIRWWRMIQQLVDLQPFFYHAIPPPKGPTGRLPDWSEWLGWYFTFTSLHVATTRLDGQIVFTCRLWSRKRITWEKVRFVILILHPPLHWHTETAMAYRCGLFSANHKEDSS